MAITPEELESFHRFATERIRNGSSLTIETLVGEWRRAQQKDHAAAAIRQAIIDIEAGNFRLLDDFMTEFRARHETPDQP
jgi:hypothetical protein